MNRETRFIPIDNVEIRLDQEENSAPKLIGYAAKFNSLSHTLKSEKYGAFREVIRKGAFTRSISNNDQVILNIDHDNSKLVARTSAGNLRLSEDEIGLRVEADLPNTTVANDLKENLKVRNLVGMSFAFTTNKDLFRKEGNETLRELHDVNLHDVSVVYTPAYPSTEVALRSFETWCEAEQAEQTPEPQGMSVDVAEAMLKLLAL